MRYLGFFFIILVLSGCEGKEIEIIAPGEAPTEVSFPQIIEEKLTPKVSLLEKNPFLTPEERERFKEERVIIDYLDLSAIFFSSDRSYAIINGQIFKEGDIVDNKRIEKIEPERVILKDASGEYLLTLKPIAER